MFKKCHPISNLSFLEKAVGLQALEGLLRNRSFFSQVYKTKILYLIDCNLCQDLFHCSVASECWEWKNTLWWWFSFAFLWTRSSEYLDRREIYCSSRPFICEVWALYSHLSNLTSTWSCRVVIHQHGVKYNLYADVHLSPCSISSFPVSEGWKGICLDREE